MQDHVETSYLSTPSYSSKEPEFSVPGIDVYINEQERFNSSQFSPNQFSYIFSSID